MRRLVTLNFVLFTIVVFSQTKEIDSLSLALAFQTSDSLRVDTSTKLIENFYEIKDYDRALKYIIECEKLSSSINHSKGLAKIAFYKASVYAKKSDYINAIDSYAKAKTLFTELKDTLYLAKVNNGIGLIEIERGNFDKGLQYSLSAIRELEQRGLHNELREAYSSLGEAYHKINNLYKSIEFNSKALEIQEQLKDTISISNSNLKLAELYSKVKEHRKAIDFYEKVLAGAKGKNDSIRSEILPKLGGEYLSFNEYETASKYLLQGLKLNRLNKNNNNLLVTLNNLGSLNLSQKRLLTAEKQLLEAGAIAKQLDNKSELLKNYMFMKALDSTKRKFASAFVWQRRYYVLKDSLEKASSQPTPEVVKISKKDLPLNYGEEKSKTEQKILVTDKNQGKPNRFKLLFYILLGMLAIACGLLVFMFLKRNRSLKHNQKLEAENLKIRSQNKAYIEQTKHLENINNVKDKLFSIVSHDLKDSLSSINGFINLLGDGSLTKEEFDDLIPELSENANNASLLLFNLLNWSKSQMQSLKPSPSLFDIQEVFEEKVKLIEQRLESKGIKMADHSLRDFAYADKSMIEIVIQNLLANAIKFSKEGDTITISNHISNGSCIISVADTGVGIPKHNIEKLFKNNSYTTVGTSNEKGTGLGLSICKELVTLNGGEIWVESTIDVGSTFYVQLPKSRLPE